MRTTLTIDNQLIKRAAQLTGVQEKSQLVRLGLEALISREAAKRLAHLVGSEPHLKDIRRRRSA
ncbi:MAG: type II toxin-antitoxin system VapB family antitoxin [Nitrospira sp.]|nr:type II toxin-antitoxin system VapB family antitoxin [Nitrospira sp.]